MIIYILYLFIPAEILNVSLYWYFFRPVDKTYYIVMVGISWACGYLPALMMLSIIFLKKVVDIVYNIS